MNRPSRRTHGRRTAAVVTLTCALTATAYWPAQAEPETLAQVHARLKGLYHDAEVATEKYNAVDEKVKKQHKRLRELKAQVAAVNRKLAPLSAAAGAAVRAQYRNGGLPVEVQITLASSPENALENASVAHQAQQTTLSVIKALRKTRDERDDRADEASETLSRLQANRRTADKQRKAIKRHIADAQAIEARLTLKQRRQLTALETQESRDAQAKWLGSGILDRIGTKAGPKGRKAIAYATAQLGKPYLWGAVGPDSFDCSGLTSRAWLAAGVPIPRTSQEQWRQLEHVPVDHMRPGDLIIYFSDASHVALYIGDGQMIQAPRTGRTVSVAPAGSMAILGVVRPDA
ncbi:NlpC/P60 family protein [Streptomyces sp. Lzd4kr]|nr:NlpC/P60 family protein [Streptomyces sp. Lzd4kr]